VDAVIQTSGRQYRVQAGQVIEVDQLPLSVGDPVVFDRVLLATDAGEVKIGDPVIAGAKVMGEVVGHLRTRKVIVFKYKPKERYRRKSGQRRSLTRVRIDQIVV